MPPSWHTHALLPETHLPWQSQHFTKSHTVHICMTNGHSPESRPCQVLHKPGAYQCFTVRHCVAQPGVPHNCAHPSPTGRFSSTHALRPNEEACSPSCGLAKEQVHCPNYAFPCCVHTLFCALITCWVMDEMSPTHLQYIPKVGRSLGCPADLPNARTPSQTPLICVGLSHVHRSASIHSNPCIHAYKLIALPYYALHYTIIPSRAKVELALQAEARA